MRLDKLACGGAGEVTVEEAEAAIRMLQHMDDGKMKEEVDALSARNQAPVPPISLSDLPKMQGNDPFASLFGGLGGMGGIGGVGGMGGGGPNGMANPFASMFGSMGGAGSAGTGGQMSGLPGLGGANPFGGAPGANPFGAMGANPFGAAGANPFGGGGGGDPFGSLLGGGNSQVYFVVFIHLAFHSSGISFILDLFILHAFVWRSACWGDSQLHFHCWV